MTAPYPFAAIVGQDEMTTALRLVAVDPKLGGVLIFGDRGVGKSTAVRALADLLPPIEVVDGCPYGCDPARPGRWCDDCPGRAADRAVETRSRPTPVVDLPLGATEDRVVGALDLERALIDGVTRFEPGLLARANRGFLYIDEVNLLEDHLVDLLLDAAASGENVVEREGMSLRHPARIVLIGSGNPEEGELRPQLLDRFGLSVEATTPRDIAVRMAVVRRRAAFDRDPEAFHDEWAAAQAERRAAIVSARAALGDVTLSDEVLEAAVRVCATLGSDGIRGELTLTRAAAAAAALAGGSAVDLATMRSVAPMALRHRLRRDPLDESGSTARVSRALDEVLGPA